MLSGLMGQVVSGCDEDFPVIPGARVMFGFNTGFASLNVGMLGTLVENEGLLYNAAGRDVAGWINPYVTIEGNSISYWESSCQLCDTIWLALRDNGVPIKPETIQCFIEKIEAETSQGQQPVLTPAPTQAPSLPAFPSLPSLPGTLPDLSCAGSDGLDWAACQLGVTRTTAVFIGVSLALVGILVLKR